MTLVEKLIAEADRWAWIQEQLNADSRADAAEPDLGLVHLRTEARIVEAMLDRTIEIRKEIEQLIRDRKESA
jgi:hypothetical protein